jgi:ketosteroid isomerase-like protein
VSTPEENKALVRRYFEETMNASNADAVDELCAPGFVNHDRTPGLGEGLPDREVEKRAIRMAREAFPDRHTTIDDMVAEGDRVVVRYTGGGTNTGPLMGMLPTGKRVTVSGIQVFRVSEGRIAETWNREDALGVLRQLGILTSPEPSGA